MIICPVCKAENLDFDSFCKDCGSNIGGTTGNLSTGAVLQERYQIVKVIGRGGMGAVYLALDLRLNKRYVAVKEMSTRAISSGNIQDAVEAFKKEAAILSNLKHPFLPAISDFFSEGESKWYLVMDYIDGENLATVLKKNGKIPQDKVMTWARELGNILDYLHGQKPPIIFRDLKPSNIMLTNDGKLKLIDFGIARHFKPEVAVDTTIYGSSGFAPPEQYGQKQTDIRSDIYSLAATLHYLLTGIDPSANPFKFEPPSKMVPVYPELEAAIMKSLSFEPEQRPASIKEFLSILDRRPTIEGAPTLPAGNRAIPPSPQPDQMPTVANFNQTTKLAGNNSPASKPKKRKSKVLPALIILILVLGGGWYAYKYYLFDILPASVTSLIGLEETGKSSESSSLPAVAKKKATEQEPNDSIQSAQAIKVNQTMTGNLQSSDDEDYYLCKIPATGKLLLNFQHDQVDSGDWHISLVDSDNENLTDFYVGRDEINKSSVNLRVAKGNYYIGVTPASYSDMEYKITARYTEEDDFYEKEPNNKIQHAQKIAVNQQYTGNLQSSGDADYYKVELKEPGKLSVNLQHEQVDDGSWRVSVLNENNHQITDFYSSRDQLNMNSLNLRMPAGNYYILIYASTFCDVDYKLTVNFSAEGEAFEKEYNDKIQHAQLIQADQEYTGNLQNSSDCDYYRIELPTDGKVEISFVHEQVDDGSWRIYFTNAENKTLTDFYAGRNELNTLSNSIRVPAGTYYVCVVNSTFNNTDYRFKVMVSQ